MDWGLPWPGAAQAAHSEAAGATAFCAGEFSDQNAYVTCAEMAASTTNAMVGPGIAYAFARSPFVHSSAVRHLDRIAPGRVFLGLGAGTARMNLDWFGVDSSKPAARMGELVETVRAFLHAENGESIEYEGDFYRIKANIMAPVHGRLDVPILIGAFNKGMLRVAGQSADGVLGHGIFTDRWWNEVVDPEVAHGAHAAGRDASGIRRWGWVITAIDDEDPRRANREARQQIAFYFTVRTYDSLVELHGWQEEVAAIRTAFRSGKADRIADFVTDEMLWAIAICGDSDQARAMLAARTRLPQTAFLATPSFLVGRRRRAGYDASATAFALDNLRAQTLPEDD